MLRFCVSAILLCVAATAPDVLAQNIVVDATPSHVANTFRPMKALGGTIDRLSAGVADTTLTEPVLSQILSAGWQTMSYRQNTELFAEAWHWNPEGAWSDPSGKGYFTGTPLLWLRAAPHGYHAKFARRRHLLFAPDRRGRNQLLEEQPILDEGLHRRRGFGSSAMGAH